IATRRLEGLIYACNEGFWNTIARGKSHKEEVYQLVSSYFRRGGQPNVAKNSPSLKSVKEGYGLLHAVVAIKNSKTVSRVLDAGANPNAVALGPKKEDCTVPLVLAAQIGYLRGVRLLVERGKADLFQRGPQQITALHAAVMHDSMETVQYLLQVSQNALLDSVDVDGATPLHAACGYGRTRIVTFFLKECQAKSDAQNHKGETPLHYAVKRRQYKTVCRLVGSLGAYPNPYVANQTPTPLDLARSCGFKAIADYLRKMGAKTTKEMEK
ncbi:ankyrin repeat-containing domain protein, partial [Dichotomocladium elegans]